MFIFRASYSCSYIFSYYEFLQVRLSVVFPFLLHLIWNLFLIIKKNNLLAVKLEKICKEVPDYFSMCVGKQMDIDQISNAVNVLACESYCKGQRDILKDVSSFQC